MAQDDTNNNKNEILEWATEVATENTLSFKDYASSKIRTEGAIINIASDPLTYNKVLSQVTKVSKGFSQVIANNGIDVTDSNSSDTIASNFQKVIEKIVKDKNSEIDNLVTTDMEIKGNAPIVSTGSFSDKKITIGINESYLNDLVAPKNRERLIITKSTYLSFNTSGIINVEVIGGGGGGGKGATEEHWAKGGDKGTASSFHEITALGGSGGAGGSNMDGGGGGQAGNIVKRQIMVIPNTRYTLIVGKGGSGGDTLYNSASARSDGQGEFGAPSANEDNSGSGGLGAPGAGNGGPQLLKIDVLDALTTFIQGGNGGSGGCNGSLYGNGGGGGGGSGNSMSNHGLGGRASSNAESGGKAISSMSSGNGGTGGNGAIIIEYEASLKITQGQLD